MKQDGDDDESSGGLDRRRPSITGAAPASPRRRRARRSIGDPQPDPAIVAAEIAAEIERRMVGFQRAMMAWLDRRYGPIGLVGSRPSRRPDLNSAPLARLLARLVAAQGVPVDWRGLAEAIGSSSRSTSVVRVHICNLRAALEREGLYGAIETHHGRGYCLSRNALPIAAALARTGPDGNDQP